jgi:uridine kinase
LTLSHDLIESFVQWSLRHTAIGDMMTVICLDDYHTNDRAGRKAAQGGYHWIPQNPSRK